MWGKPDHKKIIRPYKDEKTFWEKVEPYMDGLEEIYFAGGEPLIMEEHYRILKRLVEKKMFHVKLKYNTNFSQMTYKDIDVMKEWDKFEQVEIGASLDASHKRGEYLRKGQSWQQVEDNRKRMFDVCPRAYFFIATCLDIFNSFHVPDFHIDWYERGWIKDEGSLINPLLTPAYLRIQMLPAPLKDQLREKYNTAQEWMDNNTKSKSKRYTALIKFLDEADYSHKIKEWYRTTERLDDMRNENWRDIFPELQDLPKYIK
jgi:sulfatase maturation enzyme AslB (radical SAM superfamily)